MCVCVSHCSWAHESSTTAEVVRVCGECRPQIKMCTCRVFSHCSWVAHESSTSCLVLCVRRLCFATCNKLSFSAAPQQAGCTTDCWMVACVATLQVFGTDRTTTSCLLLSGGRLRASLRIANFHHQQDRNSVSSDECRVIACVTKRYEFPLSARPLEASCRSLFLWCLIYLSAKPLFSTDPRTKQSQRKSQHNRPRLQEHLSLTCQVTFARWCAHHERSKWTSFFKQRHIPAETLAVVARGEHSTQSSSSTPNHPKCDVHMGG